MVTSVVGRVLVPKRLGGSFGVCTYSREGTLCGLENGVERAWVPFAAKEPLFPNDTQFAVLLFQNTSHECVFYTQMLNNEFRQLHKKQSHLLMGPSAS